MAVSPIPPGHHTITPYLMLRDPAAAMEFYKKAFGAIELVRMLMPDGKSIMHAAMKIGDSIFFMATEGPGMPMASPETAGTTTVALHLYVPDVDASFAKAVAAGATVAMPPMDMFWGDRFGKVTDPFGHHWSIATHVEDLSPEEMCKRGAEAMKNMDKK